MKMQLLIIILPCSYSHKHFFLSVELMQIELWAWNNKKTLMQGNKKGGAYFVDKTQVERDQQEANLFRQNKKKRKEGRKKKNSHDFSFSRFWRRSLVRREETTSFKIHFKGKRLMLRNVIAVSRWCSRSAGEISKISLG